ncbi:uncharacterized protein LOC110870328 [Helianthus annuus]|uniref:uncharacterized protein LOC110870328 n=1 Tax=Helianthus annuus TaxID=4232 RepID=UPI000B8F04C3|nr:uncharacterized protein LOC110870328 [Helianthus annuus]
MAGITAINVYTSNNLCYADDVLFVEEWIKGNVVALSRLLRCLSLVTGLNINAKKCNLYGVGVNDSEVERLAGLLNCQKGNLPLDYLGVPIRTNMKRISKWQPVIDRFEKKLASWKANSLSFAGRVTLAKSVLGSLPSYFLWIFKAPSSVLKKLERIRRDFVWGKNGEKIK